MGELVADAAKQQLDYAAPTSPTDNDQIRVLAVRDVRDDPGGAAVLDDHPVRQTRLAKGAAPDLLHIAVYLCPPLRVERWRSRIRSSWAARPQRRPRSRRSVARRVESPNRALRSPGRSHPRRQRWSSSDDSPTLPDLLSFAPSVSNRSGRWKRAAVPANSGPNGTARSHHSAPSLT